MLCAVQYVAEVNPDLAMKAMQTAPRGARLAVPHNLQIVYFVRFQNAVKIGTTTNLPQRMKDIIHDEVLAIEPGGTAQEHRRHREFAQYRTQREWFMAAPSLLELTDKLRSVYGDPYATWDEWSSAETRRTA